MNQPRQPIEAALREHLDHRQFGAPPVGAILARGARLRRRRATLTATAGLAAVALVGGLGWTAMPQPGGGSGVSPVGSPKPTASALKEPSEVIDAPSATPDQWPPAGVTLTPCAEIPRIAEPGAIDDFTVDVENGILTFTLPTTQGERTVDIAYERDQECRRHPDVLELIKRVEGTVG